MADFNSLCHQIAVLFAEEMNLEVPSVEADLIETGLLDSLKFVELVFAIEQQFGVCVSLDDLEIENFRCIARIAEFVAGRQGAPPSPSKEDAGLLTVGNSPWDYGG